MNTNNQTQDIGYPSGSLVEQRVNFILYEISQGRGELTDEVIAELAELDGSDTRTPEQIQADSDWLDEIKTKASNYPY